MEKREKQTNETESIRREKKKTSPFSNHEDGNGEGKGEAEVYSVATCTSSQKNFIIRCVRYVARKPNDSGRVRRRDEA